MVAYMFNRRQNQVDSCQFEAILDSQGYVERNPVSNNKDKKNFFTHLQINNP